MDEGGGTRSSKNLFGSCLSRVDANVVTYDADIDQVEEEEEVHLNKCDGVIITSDDDDDAGSFSIANDYSSKNDDTLANEQKEEMNLSAARTRRTGQNKISSAEGFMLAREAVDYFVHDFIAHAVDRQKRNADNN